MSHSVELLRSTAPRVRERHACAALLAVALVAVFAWPAHAGLGGLVKSAKDKATRAAAPKPAAPASASGPCAPPVFDDVMLELTPERLDHLLAGLKAAADGKAQRAPILARKAAAEKERDDTQTKYYDAIEKAREKRRATERCWSPAMDETRDARNAIKQQEIQNSPAMMQKYMAYAQKIGAAQASGDTAQLRRLNEELLGPQGYVHEDTLHAIKQCGAMPPKHAMDDKLEALIAKVTTIDGELRDQEQRSLADQIKASQLEELQYGMARERVEMYLAAVQNKPKPCGFTPAELAALEARKDRLEAALKAL